MSMELSEQDPLARLKQFEDHFVERKTANDKSDWLKTVVAFANSAPVGYPAVLFIGVRNDGTIEENVNLDSLQKTFNKIVNSAHPPIYRLPKILEKDGKQCLAVIVPGSETRPHFAGQAFVRQGSETLEASQQQFEELIAVRSSKAYEILKYKGKTVTFTESRDSSLGICTTDAFGLVESCSRFYVTLRFGSGDISRLSLCPELISRSTSLETSSGWFWANDTDIPCLSPRSTCVTQGRKPLCLTQRFFALEQMNTA